MLIHGNSSGLNKGIWAPYFSLKKVRSKLREKEKVTYIVERYIGEMFLNSMLSKDVTSYCRVNIIDVITE